MLHRQSNMQVWRVGVSMDKNYINLGLIIVKIVFTCEDNIFHVETSWHHQRRKSKTEKREGPRMKSWAVQHWEVEETRLEDEKQSQSVDHSFEEFYSKREKRTRATAGGERRARELFLRWTSLIYFVCWQEMKQMEPEEEEHPKK